ncbi:hypothetical protein DFH29DRAFT_1037000, partial [Suillus ampliporus]
MRQRSQAHDPLGTYTFTGWTVTYGFFAWMGGFMLHVNNKPQATLTPSELLHFVCEGLVDMPNIMQRVHELSGLSRSHYIGCIYLQCIMDIRQTYKIEVRVMDYQKPLCYCLWWKKPKDVRHPYIVHWKAIASPSDLTYIFHGHWHGHFHPCFPFMLGSISRWLWGIFGFIHFLGGNPTVLYMDLEQQLWHMSSTVVTIAPLMVFLTFALKSSLFKKGASDVPRRQITILSVLRSIVTYFAAFYAFIYPL